MRIVTACWLISFIQLVACSDGSSPQPGFFPEMGPGFSTGTTGAGGDAIFMSGGGVGGSRVSGDGTYDQPLVVASNPPPALSGGTLLAFDGGHKAAVADPDRDQVVIVDLDKLTVSSTVALQKGDEPGRAVQDSAGTLHVALRSGGAIAVIDPAAGTLVRRDPACDYPRGIAYDPASDAVHVACAGGELVTLSAKDGKTTRTIKIARDLRDVVIDGDHLLVSRFRSAELLVIDAEGAVVSTIKPPNMFTGTSFEATPAVAWRTIAAPGGGVLMVHQQDLVGELPMQPGVFGGLGCGAVVQTAVSLIRRDGTKSTTPLSVVLGIDLAIAAGDTPMVFVPSTAVRQGTTPWFVELPVPAAPGPPQTFESLCTQQGTATSGGPGRIVALAVDSTGQPIQQTREPFALVVGDKTLSLPGATRRDTGHDLFHLATSVGLACASCHPEGRDDGRVWKFSVVGPRRTPSIGGAIAGTEPFFWNGDMSDFLTLAHYVFNQQMLGPVLLDDYVTALSKWIEARPAWKPSAPGDAAAIERGRALFDGPEAGCATCHRGPKLTNNASADVGTGGKFQVPSLRGVAWRAPFMHHGCAPSLGDLTCGGIKHGSVSDGGTSQADLAAYLETL